MQTKFENFYQKIRAFRTKKCYFYVDMTQLKTKRVAKNPKANRKENSDQCKINFEIELFNYQKIKVNLKN